MCTVSGTANYVPSTTSNHQDKPSNSSSTKEVEDQNHVHLLVPNRPPIEVFGPPGTRQYVRESLKWNRVGCKYVVYELHPTLLEDQPPKPESESLKTESAEGKRMDKDGTLHVDELPGVDLYMSYILPPPIDPATSSSPNDQPGPQPTRDQKLQHAFWYIPNPTFHSLLAPSSSTFSNSTNLTILAFPIPHSVPSLAYGIWEADQKPSLNSKFLVPLLKQHKDRLGLKNPLVLLRDVKEGKKVILPPLQTTVETMSKETKKQQEGLSNLEETEKTEKEEEVLIDPIRDAHLIYDGPPKRGRGILICGDTSDASHVARVIQNLKHNRTAMLHPQQSQQTMTGLEGLGGVLNNPEISSWDVDVVVHEATNSCLESDVQEAYQSHLKSAILRDDSIPDSTLDQIRSEQMRTVENQTISHGHSTPQIAARFAKSVDAQVLLLNHFSSRYKGDESVESLEVMQEIRVLAEKEFLEERGGGKDGSEGHERVGEGESVLKMKMEELVGVGEKVGRVVLTTRDFMNVTIHRA
jgi:ribonuclease BN (tRNA processing enzyme)